MENSVLWLFLSKSDAKTVFRLDMGNLEKKILAVCSVADGVKHEVNQLAEMKKHLDAIK